MKLWLELFAYRLHLFSYRCVVSSGGFVHGDVCVHSVFVRSDWTVCLGKFGLFGAQVFLPLPFTRGALVPGHVSHSSKELLTSGQVTEQSDTYALRCGLVSLFWGSGVSALAPLPASLRRHTSLLDIVQVSGFEWHVDEVAHLLTAHGGRSLSCICRELRLLVRRVPASLPEQAAMLVDAYEQLDRGMSVCLCCCLGNHYVLLSSWCCCFVALRSVLV